MKAMMGKAENNIKKKKNRREQRGKKSATKRIWQAGEEEE